MATETFADRMVRDGYTAGFDYLRVGLAFAVVLWHSVVVSGDLAARAMALGPVLGPLQALILPMFFALSGFLVSGSVERSKTMSGFVTLRVIRLMPALAVEVLLSALILGPIVTTVTFAEYFTAPAFFSYFWNIVGHVHFELPGVFEANPRAGIVNISLWTVPFELECYLALVGLAVFGVFRQPRLFASITLILVVLATIVLLVKTGGVGEPGKINGRILVLSFLCGNVLYLYRAKIPLSPILAIVSFIMSFMLVSFAPTRPLCVLPAAYLTVFLGLQNPRKIMGGDYSYGVYLFSFPIQQLIAQAPPLRSWWVVFLLTVPISLAYAAFSWRYVEKPVLDRKKGIVARVENMVQQLKTRLGYGRRTEMQAETVMISRSSLAEHASDVNAEVSTTAR